MATQLTEATLARGMRDDRLVSADPLADAGDVIAGLDRLTAASWEDMPGQTVLEALDQVEQASRRLEAVRARVVSAAHADGLWVLDGARSLTAWLRDRTGASTGAASRWVRESRALRDVLPATERALTDGRIGADHVHVLVRETIRTHALRAQLGDPQIGEDFLVEQAERLDATAFNTVAKAWATAADPEGADRAWREADAKEELTIAPTLGGFHVVGWLSEKTGRIVHRALDAHMGRRPEGDERTSSQRRVDALAALAHQSLDAGLQQASARVRPHVTITVPWATLGALPGATGTARPVPEQPDPWADRPSDADVSTPTDQREIPRSGNWQAFTYPEDSSHVPRGPGGHGEPPGTSSAEAEWASGWRSGDDHVIATRIDHKRLHGLEPASFSDGTPLAPGLLARLACESTLSRVVFGADSTILDVGREKRIFPAHQARGVIARDRHCQYPGCHEGPEFGEIHHSLWWGRHNGPTSTDHGILLCWHHHDLVHSREIAIVRSGDAWHFTNRYGAPITAPPHSRMAHLTQPSSPDGPGPADEHRQPDRSGPRDTPSQSG